MVDGSNARLSCMWVRGSAREGDYVAVELNKVTEINNIIFEHGEPGAGDGFNYVKFQYSMDGENWTDLNDKSYGPNLQKIVIDNLNVTAKYARAMPTGEILGNWISVREFSINADDSENIVRNIYTNVETIAENKVNILPSNATLTDVNGVTLAEGQYIGIKLNSIRELTNIIADITNIDKLTLETSINGVEWTTVENITDTVAAAYIRVINNSKDSVTVDITNLEVKYSDKNVTFDIRAAAEANFEPINLIDGKLNTAFKPQLNAPKTGSLVYKISDNTEITNFTIIQDPLTTSDAVVSVRTENGWAEIGSLVTVTNIFNTSNFNNVFEIKVAWDGVAPTLCEIGTSTKKDVVEEEKPEDESKPEEDKPSTEVKPATPTNGTGNGENNSQGENNKPQNDNNKPGKGDKLPNTGGDSAVVVLSIGGMISALGVVAIKKRR